MSFWEGRQYYWIRGVASKSPSLVKISGRRKRSSLWKSNNASGIKTYNYASNRQKIFMSSRLLYQSELMHMTELIGQLNTLQEDKTWIQQQCCASMPIDKQSVPDMNTMSLWELGASHVVIPVGLWWVPYGQNHPIQGFPFQHLHQASATPTYYTRYQSLRSSSISRFPRVWLSFWAKHVRQ